MPNKLIKQLSFIFTLLLLLTSISANAAVKVGSYFGNWSAKTTYSAGDLITYSNKTFLSLVVKNKNKNPNSNPKAWQLFGGISTGAQGPQGPAGIGSQGTATGDMQWWNGSKWVMIPVSANNAILKNCNGIPTWVASSASCPFIIGDPGPAGGIIFYLNDNTGLHGLEAAPVDQAISQWGCRGASIDGTSALLGTGLANTDKIVARCGEANTAAKVAQAYTLNGFSDWYLPSKDELNLMYTAIGQGAIKPLVNVDFSGTLNYWSSTEFNNTNAWSQDFQGGWQNTSYFKNAGIVGVHAVRSF
jgi:hypothetical protein